MLNAIAGLFIGFVWGPIAAVGVVRGRLGRPPPPAASGNGASGVGRLIDDLIGLTWLGVSVLGALALLPFVGCWALVFGPAAACAVCGLFMGVAGLRA